MNRLGVIYNGAYPERKLLNMPQYANRIAAQVYLPQISSTDLSQFDALIVPEGSHHGCMLAASEQLGEFVQAGGTVMTFGDQPVRWLPQLNWEFRVARLPKPGEVVVESQASSFHRYVTLDDLYHHHGVFHPAQDIEVLYASNEGGAILYRDHTPENGCLLVSSMDLFVHAAMANNPVSHRFLDRFLDWATTEPLRS